MATNCPMHSVANGTKRVLALLCSVIATACAGFALHEIDRAEIRGNANPKKAYLIVNLNVYPPDRRQPTWISIYGVHKGAHLSTSKYIFELEPGTYRVTHMDFLENPERGTFTVYFRETPEIELEAGVIHYYGRMEIESNLRRRLIRTIDDRDIFRRACEQAPSIFEQFDVVPIGPLARHDLALAACDKLPTDSVSDSSSIRR